MQLVARFSKDRPWWTMAFNSAEPNHWIKTEWLDTGAVISFQSKSRENPHISEDARDWHKTLLTGHYAARMLDSEWVGEFNNVGAPRLLEDVPSPGSTDRLFCSIWVDAARGHRMVRGYLRNKCKSLIIRSDEPVNNLSDLTKIALDAYGKSEIFLVRSPRSASRFPKMAGRRIYLADKIDEYAEILGIDGYRLAFAPDLNSIYKDFAAWCYRARSAHDMEFGVSRVSGSTLACCQALAYFGNGNQPFEVRYD